MRPRERVSLGLYITWTSQWSSTWQQQQLVDEQQENNKNNKNNILLVSNRRTHRASGNICVVSPARNPPHIVATLCILSYFQYFLCFIVWLSYNASWDFLQISFNLKRLFPFRFCSIFHCCCFLRSSYLSSYFWGGSTESSKRLCHWLLVGQVMSPHRMS